MENIIRGVVTLSDSKSVLQSSANTDAKSINNSKIKAHNAAKSGSSKMEHLHIMQELQLSESATWK